MRREAPERLEVPSGSQIRIAYEPGRPPVLAARIQEMFGLAETPRVAAGRVPVLLHLLAPNGRPQQVTHDLRSFWETTYRQVRKELAGPLPQALLAARTPGTPSRREGRSGAEPRSSTAAPWRSAGIPRSPPSAAPRPARPASQRSST